MNTLLTPIARCMQIAGIGANEMLVGVAHGAEHERLLTGYRRARSPTAARLMVVADMRRAAEIGEARRAADLLIVLRRLLAAENVGAGNPAPAPRRARPARLRRAWSFGGAKGAAATKGGDVLTWPGPSR